MNIISSTVPPAVHPGCEDASRSGWPRRRGGPPPLEPPPRCGARIWIYAVSDLIGACAILTAVIVTCMCIFKRHQQHYTPLADTGTVGAEAVEVPKDDTINPTYGQAI